MIANGLKLEDLLAIKSQFDKTYKFCLPGSEEEIDIRDYILREIDGMYFLTRREDPKFEFEFNASHLTGDYKPKFHFAHYIYLKDCTTEFAEKMLGAFPCLEK